MGSVKTATIRLDQYVPAGSMVLDQYGSVVGSVVSIVKVTEGQDPPVWEVTTEVAFGTDTTSLQVMPRAGIVGSVNNA